MRALPTNEEWIEWGRRDPLFGVASWEGRQRGGPAEWTDDEFYALGKSDWADFASMWRRFEPSLDGAVVEIGCGAGRITWCLPLSFSRVYALDVSPDMLAFARSRVPDERIVWQMVAGTEIPLPDRSVDAVFSCHVLQHLPDADAVYSYIGEAARVLRSGGTIFVHLPVHSFPTVNRSFSRLAARAYEAFGRAAHIKAGLRRRAMRRGGPGYMHGTSLARENLVQKVLQFGFADIALVTFPLTANGSLHSCLFARRPG